MGRRSPAPFPGVSCCIAGHLAAFLQPKRAGRTTVSASALAPAVSPAGPLSPTEPFRVPVRFQRWAGGDARAASPKDPVRGLCQTLQGDCVMRTVLSTDWRAPSMAGCLLGLVLIAAATPAAAQGTPEQRAACEQDAYRLCSQYIPDERRTGNCLRRNRISLSPACRRLFSSGRGRRR
jgi:hypothetical protein